MAQLSIRMTVVLKVCGCVIFLATMVNSIVHNKYVYDRFNDSSDNDFKIVLPDESEEPKSTLVLVNVVSVLVLITIFMYLYFQYIFVRLKVDT